MQVIGKVLSRITTLTTLVAGVAIALMMLHVSLDVVFRYWLRRPLPGTLTVVSYYYMVIAAFVPIAFAEMRRAHISMEALTELLPKRPRRWLEGWLYLPTGIVTGMIAWRGFEEAFKQHALGAAQIQGSTSIPTWPAYYALPIGMGLMTLLLVFRFYTFLTGRPNGVDDMVPSEPESER